MAFLRLEQATVNTSSLKTWTPEDFSLFLLIGRFLGMASEGIYRKSGVTSRVTALLEQFRTDARSQCLREGVNLVDDVSSTLKRFFRELEDGLFTSVDAGSWLSTAGKVLQSHLKERPHAPVYA